MKYLIFLFLILNSHIAIGGAEIPLRDADGNPITRNKVSKTGWTYQGRSLEFTTSTISSLNNDKWDGSAWGDATIKFYDNEDAELTVANDINTQTVKTVVDWEPLYNFEIIGGHVTVDANPGQDVRVWVVAVPDLTEVQGGTKVMVNGINLNFIAAKGALVFDGRASKQMDYNATYHTNKMRLIVRHSAGKNLKMAVVWEHYKP